MEALWTSFITNIFHNKAVFYCFIITAIMINLHWVWETHSSILFFQCDWIEGLHNLQKSGDVDHVKSYGHLYAMDKYHLAGEECQQKADELDKQFS